MKLTPIKGFGIIAVLLFFFNNAALPYNLQFSILLFPFFLYYLHKIEKVKIYYKTVVVLLLWSLLHYLNGALLVPLAISTMVMLAIVTFCFAFYYHYLSHKYDQVYANLSRVNLFFVAVAVLFFAFNELRPITWYLVPITPNYPVIPRLKLFELEASHYSLALVPLFYYWALKVVKGKGSRSVFWLVGVLISLILSFSIGVWGVLFFGVIGVIGLNYKAFFLPEKSRLFLLIAIGIGVFITGIVVFTENPLSFRLNNLLDGKDTSGRGRTYEAFLIAWETLKSKNAAFFGIGLGQFKIIGKEVLLGYYKFEYNPNVIRLPNVMAETLVTYGVLGIVVKLALQIGLFIKLKVRNNLFQLAVFISLFIYQFTGSYLFHSMEYVLWAIAFVPQFESFDRKIFFKQ